MILQESSGDDDDDDDDDGDGDDDDGDVMAVIQQRPEPHDQQ